MPEPEDERSIKIIGQPPEPPPGDQGWVLDMLYNAHFERRGRLDLFVHEEDPDHDDFPPDTQDHSHHQYRLAVGGENVLEMRVDLVTKAIGEENGSLGARHAKRTSVSHRNVHLLKQGWSQPSPTQCWNHRWSPRVTAQGWGGNARYQVELALRAAGVGRHQLSPIRRTGGVGGPDGVELEYDVLGADGGRVTTVKVKFTHVIHAYISIEPTNLDPTDDGQCG